MPTQELPAASATASAVNVAPKVSTRESLVSNLTAGTLSALVTLSYSVSYGVLIFSGPDLQPHLATGLHSALMSAWVVALIVALLSSFHFSIAGPDSNATAILALMSAAIASAVAAKHNYVEEIPNTVQAMLIVSAILVGLMAFLLGAIKRGRLVRFLPYPVIGGFLAGTGFLVVGGGFKVLTGKALSWENIVLFPRVHPLGWAVALGLAAALLTLPRKYKHFMVMPSLIIGSTAVFYIGMKLCGIGVEAARGMDMLFQPIQPFETQIGAPPFLETIRWDVMAAQWQNFLAMTIVVIVTILLNSTGLDLATQSDVDFDRELRANGIANMVTGSLGGMIGYISISRSLLNFKAGAHSRFAGVWTALICLGATYVFTPAISYIPKPVLAGLLLFLGLGMLREWILEAFHKLPLIEYELLLTIFMLILVLGLMPGVAFGLLVASVSFVYTYSKATCIKHTFSSNTHFSNKERSLEHIQLLRQKGHVCRALALQGYIFFGTSSTIVEQSRELIEKERIRFLLLDFRRVQGLDASAVLSFTKLEQVCRTNGVKLILTGLRADTEEVLEQTQFLPNRRIKLFPDMDHGLEWVEDSLLGVVAGAIFDLPDDLPGSEGMEMDLPFMGTAAVAEMDLRRILAAHFKQDALDVVISHCQTIKLPEGTTLIKQGDAADALYFVERGELTVQVNLPGGQSKRLRTFGPGTVVGEMGLYGGQPRSADVVANMASRVRKFSAENIRKMEQENPEVAIQFHTFVIKLLCVRLAAANEEIRTLL